MAEEAIEPRLFREEQTLSYFVEARDGRKRSYIFDYGKSRVCQHNELKSLAKGGIVYRCMECNYAFHIVSAYQQPLHNEAIQSAFNLLHFAKEFGSDALGEVLHRAIGQGDGTPQKPVLPEGMDFSDAVRMLDEVDVNTPDGGASQLASLMEDTWVGPKEQALREARVAKKERKALEANGGTDAGSGEEGSGKDS